ncbi:MAG TPA: metal ABC transporter permease [Acidimicrobiales bacterium]|jgi:zinc/manganese transport system permease protein|nr:metal ABC transporter permease [Acidimicrobiales bacterium]
MSTFLSNPAVHTALLVGLLVAAVSGPVGVFTILRGQSFAGHSLADIGTAGGAASYLIGTNVLVGFVSVNVVAAALMESAGANRARNRDVATGVVLGAALGLSALFLHLETESSTTGATIDVLFGSIFTLGSTTVPFVVGAAAIAIGLLVWIHRPLMLASVAPDLAGARGVPVGLVGAGYLVALAMAVSLSAVAIGAILSTALLIGPAAIAIQLTRRPLAAVVASGAIGVAVTWGGIALAWNSYYWSSSHQQWPVSFFIVSLVLVAFIGTSFGSRR